MSAMLGMAVRTCRQTADRIPSSKERDDAVTDYAAVVWPDSCKQLVSVAAVSLHFVLADLAVMGKFK